MAGGSQAGIESIETGMSVLLAFVRLGARSHQLKNLAEAAGMPPSKVHRYLVSLIRMGFVERDELNGNYRLGTQAIQLGASALDANDAISLSVEALVALHMALGHTMALSVWGSAGPVIVRVEEADRLVAVGIRVGRSLPLLDSAAGLVFCAFLPPGKVLPLLKAEVSANRQRRDERALKSMKDAQRLLDSVRARGLVRVASDLTPGIVALGAPVFDHRGTPATVLSAIIPARSPDAAADGRAARALRRRTMELSGKLGYIPIPKNS